MFGVGLDDLLFGLDDDFLPMLLECKRMETKLSFTVFPLPRPKNSRRNPRSLNLTLKTPISTIDSRLFTPFVPDLQLLCPIPKFLSIGFSLRPQLEPVQFRAELVDLISGAGIAGYFLHFVHLLFFY